ncbi:alpha/beta hydrolase [Luteibacter sp.]|jgi:pimeloyl-ACP methyl ester carboxylesterase|uniref:alpha/beta hydrolase n=1 Tax=Luteibacter sp. TaxID=1886636 RepID=UPI002F3F3346
MTALAENSAPSTTVYAGTLPVGLVRVKAGQPSRKQGAIFFNFGGPGANPIDILPGMVYLWSMSAANDPLDGDTRRLSDQYDLVAVIPRGLEGSTPVHCPGLDVHDPRFNADDDRQWVKMIDGSKRASEACSDWRRQFMGTQHHVGDMELARRALGEPVMNFLGYSYGTWVGAAYAATFPQYAGRIVLDSSMNYSGTFEDQLNAGAPERQSMFHRFALAPAVSDARYGLGSDGGAVLERIRQLPPRALASWVYAVKSPEDLVAVLVMGEWLRHEPKIDSARLLDLIRSRHFSQTEELDTAIRDRAIDLAPLLGTVPSHVDEAVYTAVICGDTPWRNDAGSLRAMAQSHMALYPAAASNHISLGLLCRNWPFPTRWRPSLTELAKAPPLLIVQAEFDPATPLALARKAFIASPGAYMVVALGMNDHGVFGSSAAPCAEQAVSRYLLAGELPKKRFSACPFEARPAGRVEREAQDGRSIEDEVRARIRTLLRRS